MTCQELMIGDYIQSHKQIYRVAGIKPLADIELIVMDTDGKLLDIFIDDVEPVLITPKILEKNGFYYENNVGDVLEYYNYEIIYNTWEHELRILENREQILKIKTFDEMCVHELQHALMMCGIDKEIEL